MTSYNKRRNPQPPVQPPVRMSDTEYAVHSHTDPRLIYSVVSHESGLSCSCKGYGYRRTCTHIQEVQDFIDATAGLTTVLDDTLDVVVDLPTHIKPCELCGAALPATHVSSGLCPACYRAMTLKRSSQS